MTRRGLTTRDVGGALGIDHSSVARWLKGSTPRGATAKALAEIVGLPVEVLLNDSMDLPAAPSTVMVARRSDGTIDHEATYWNILPKLPPTMLTAHADKILADDSIPLEERVAYGAKVMALLQRAASKQRPPKRLS